MKSRKDFFVAVIVLAAMALSACSIKQPIVPKTMAEQRGSMKEIERGVGILDPATWPDLGIKKVTIFAVKLDFGLLGVEGINGGGVWPIIALLPNGNYRLGYVSTFSHGSLVVNSASRMMFNINIWGDPIGFAEFYCGRDELKGARFLIMNRNATWALFDLTGRMVAEAVSKEDARARRGKNFGIPVPYNVKKFYNDKEYREKIFESFGLTLEDLARFRADYFRRMGRRAESMFPGVREITVGSDAYRDYATNIQARIDKGELYRYQVKELFSSRYDTLISHLDKETFVRVSSQIAGHSHFGRFVRNEKLGIVDLALGNFVPYFWAAKFARDIIVSNTDGLRGPYANARVERKDLYPEFQKLYRMYYMLIVYRDYAVRDIAAKNRALRRRIRVLREKLKDF